MPLRNTNAIVWFNCRIELMLINFPFPAKEEIVTPDSQTLSVLRVLNASRLKKKS